MHKRMFNGLYSWIQLHFWWNSSRISTLFCKIPTGEVEKHQINTTVIIDISTEAFSIRILSGIFQEFFKNSHRNSDWIPIGKAAIMKESRKIGKIQTLAYLLKMKLQLQPKRLEWRSSWFFQYEQCEASVNSWMNCCIKDEQFFCPKLVSLLFFPNSEKSTFT